MSEKRWLTCKEVGIILSLSPKTVSDLALRGELPSVKVGGSRRIDLRALERNLETQIAGQKPKRRR